MQEYIEREAAKERLRMWIHDNPVIAWLPMPEPPEEDA